MKAKTKLRLAKFLNAVCVDEPPVAYDWETAPKWRRDLMRARANVIADIIERSEK